MEPLSAPGRLDFPSTPRERGAVVGVSLCSLGTFSRKVSRRSSGGGLSDCVWRVERKANRDSRHSATVLQEWEGQ